MNIYSIISIILLLLPKCRAGLWSVKNSEAAKKEYYSCRNDTVFGIIIVIVIINVVLDSQTEGTWRAK